MGPSLVLRLSALSCCWFTIVLSSAPVASANEELVVLHVKAPETARARTDDDGGGGGAAAAAPSGSAASPFLTIEAARDHLRALRSSRGSDDRRYRVIIGAGTYAPLELQAQDSGRPGRSIIYEADRGDGPAIISGGVQVPKSTFTKWVGHPGIVKADLSSLGLNYGSVTAGGGCGGDCTGFAKAGLVFKNRSMVLARWPNVNNVTGKYTWEMVKIPGGNGFSVKDPAVVHRMAKWTAEADPWLHSYAKYDWSDGWNRINISASATEVNVTITDHAPNPPAADVATSTERVAKPHTANGVWVIKITAQAGKGWSKPWVYCNGTANDIFRVLTVPAGSPQDPLKGQCKQYHVNTQNILQVSSNNGSTWVLASSNSTSGIRGTLACGNDLQKIASATFGPFCSTVDTQASCVAQTPRCIWQKGQCHSNAPPPPPPPPPPPIPGPHPFSVGQAKFYGANLLCELDVPGEFFIDEMTHTLYFFPPIPLEDWTDGPFITQHLFASNVSGTSHVTLRGLGIHHSRGNGLLAIDVHNVRIEDCEISGHGQHGVVMNGTNSGIDSSSVHSVGCSGVRVAGGVPRTLTAGNMYVTNNRIVNFSLWKRTYVPGIFWQGVGNNYSYNFVHNGPHNCMLGGGNEGWPWGQGPVTGDGSQCLFEGNTLDTCVYECGDCGAFYSCGQQGTGWINRGNILRNGIFNNIGSWSIYLDDQMSGWTIEDTTINGAANGLLLGGGRRNRVRNNNFANVASAIVLDDRGMNWEHDDCLSTAANSMSDRVRQMLYPGSSWATQYPELANVTTDTPCAPAYCEVSGNRYESSVKSFLTGGGSASWPSWHVTIANNTNTTQ